MVYIGLNILAKSRRKLAQMKLQKTQIMIELNKYLISAINPES